MKKIVIVGGGITGCVSAIYCAQLGFKVEIYEKKNSLGGVISDIELENDFFLMVLSIITKKKSVA